MREGDLVPSLFLSSNVNCQKKYTTISFYILLFFTFFTHHKEKINIINITTDNQ